MEISNIPNSFHFHIEEYGKIVQQYDDIDLDSFKKEVFSLIDKHFNSNKSRQVSNNSATEIKNIAYRIYTY